MDPLHLLALIRALRALRERRDESGLWDALKPAVEGR